MLLGQYSVKKAPFLGKLTRVHTENNAGYIQNLKYNLYDNDKVPKVSILYGSYNSTLQDDTMQCVGAHICTCTQAESETNI
jgi:hypothetical protein